MVHNMPPSSRQTWRGLQRVNSHLGIYRWFQWFQLHPSGSRRPWGLFFGRAASLGGGCCWRRGGSRRQSDRKGPGAGNAAPGACWGRQKSGPTEELVRDESAEFGWRSGFIRNSPLTYGQHCWPAERRTSQLRTFSNSIFFVSSWDLKVLSSNPGQPKTLKMGSSLTISMKGVGLDVKPSYGSWVRLCVQLTVPSGDGGEQITELKLNFLYLCPPSLENMSKTPKRPFLSEWVFKHHWARWHVSGHTHCSSSSRFNRQKPQHTHQKRHEAQCHRNQNELMTPPIAWCPSKGVGSSFIHFNLKYKNLYSLYRTLLSPKLSPE